MSTVYQNFGSFQFTQKKLEMNSFTLQNDDHNKRTDTKQDKDQLELH